MMRALLLLTLFTVLCLAGATLTLLFPSRVIALQRTEWNCTRMEKAAGEERERCVVYERKGWR